MDHFNRLLRRWGFALLLSAAPVAAVPAQAAPEQGVQSEEVSGTPSATPDATPAAPAARVGAAPAAQFCANIADPAADARFAWQAKMLADLEQQLAERIAELDRRQAEFEGWMQRRDAFLKKAEDGVVAIYAKMRPDAAAQQLSTIDDETAAAVLAKLVPRNASAILNEMDPQRAAQLTMAIAGPPANTSAPKETE
jgi:flagellar motility protein MotE (MotC chaperone)